MNLEIFRLPVLTRAVLRIVSQAMSRGGLFTIKTSFRALPIVLHLPEHFKLNRLMNSPSLRALTRHQPRLGYKYLGNYLAHNLSRQDRLHILFHHYDYLAQQVQGHFFAALLDGVPLWQDCHDGDMMSIRLSFPSGIDFEGDLALTFALNQVDLYNIAFVVAPGKHVHSPLARALFVTRIQGTRQFDLIRHCTKSCHDIVPAALLVAALQGIATALHISLLVGVSNDKRLADGATFDHDSFWSSFQAERTKKDLFFLALPLVKTPIDLIKGKRRERTLRKRHYKDQVAEAAQAQFARQLLAQQAA